MQVAECNTNRLRMMAEAAESSMAIKILVVKVSDPVPYCTAVGGVHDTVKHAHNAAEKL